jgi:phenylpropionate dioxygenase-like ring-hydroxylating dioxygenase large terminal subunit
MEWLKDEWYAVARADRSPGFVQRVQLFGGEYVLFVPPHDPPALVQPFCPHRGALLRAAAVSEETLQCVYHGWQFDSSGACVHIPQLDEGIPIPPKAHLSVWPVVERYGLYWTCIGTPTTDGPPGWHEVDELGWRVAVDFFEPWEVCALRIIDNNIDQSHPAFVHQETFGDPSRALVPRYELERTERGFRGRVAHEVAGVGPQMGITDETLRFERITEVELLDMMHTRILLAYNGLAPDYCFYGSATPLDDNRSLYVRVSALAGTPEEQPYDMFWDFSRRVTEEDKVVLESTDPDFPLEATSEVHLRADRTTLEYRRLLAAAARAADASAASPSGG